MTITKLRRKQLRARNTGIILLGHTSSINLAKFSAWHLFGDRIRSSNLFVVTSRTRINDDFTNDFNGITSPLRYALVFINEGSIF